MHGPRSGRSDGSADGRAEFGVLRRLASAWVRRIVVAIVLGTFVPVTSAAIACQVHCATQPAQAAGAAADDRHASHGDGGSTTSNTNFDRYLTHGGPCHLAAVPAVVDAPWPAPVRALQPAWLPAPMAACITFIGPPPEHRPRA